MENYDIEYPLHTVECITDWTQRIASYTDEQKQFYHDMVQKLEEFKGIVRSTHGWDSLVDNKADKIKVECKRSIRGFQMMRANGPIDGSPIDVFRAMSPKEFHPEWDLNGEVSERLKKIGANAFIHYKKLKRKLVVSSRDIVSNMLMNLEEDGSVVTVASSLNCTYQHPE